CGAQPQHQHRIVPGRDRCAPVGLPRGAVLRARGPCPGGGAAGRVSGRQGMRVPVRVAVALVLLLTALGRASADERVLNFVSDVTVEGRGEVAVVETFAVRAEGHDIRRGIRRDFPTTYYRPDGSRVEVGFEVQSVTRDGNPEHWTTERFGNGIRVQIGNADVFLTTER